MMILYLIEAAVLLITAVVAFKKARVLMAVGFLLCTIPPLLTAVVVSMEGIPPHITFIWRYGVHGARIIGFALLLVGIVQTKQKDTEQIGAH
jgi:uncharacterized membrane protein